MIGKQVSHYRIVAFLGGGAMGKVYKAEDTLLKRSIALKFLPSTLTDDPDSCARFMREAQAASSLDHPNICTVHEIDRTNDGVWFIAMAWYRGRTLKKILETGPLDPLRAGDFTRQLALGLAHAHRRGVIHRDVKPANIMITHRDEVKIVDFGLARLADEAHLTMDGTVMGTAGYMAPEQARGEDAGPEADIWATGVVLFEMLTGRLPFRGDNNMALLHAVQNNLLEPLPALTGTEDLRPILARCLAFEAQDRYPHGEELALALGGSLSDRITPHPDRANAQTIRLGAQRAPRKLTGLLLGILLALILTMVGFKAGVLEFPGLRGEEPSRGIAVLPFTLMGEDEGAFEFGQGLGWTITDRLSRLEKTEPGFWVLAPGRVQALGIQSRQDVEGALGIERTISAAGHLEDNILTMLVTYFDSREGSQATREFQDNLANLKTWQSNLATWLAEILDLDAERAAGWDLFSGCTTVPAAFVPCQQGIGRMLVSIQKEDIQPAYEHFAGAVEQDSSYAMAWTGMGRTLWFLGRKQGEQGIGPARDALLRGARLDTTCVWPLVYLGNLEERLGHTGVALEYYHNALAVDPVHSFTLHSLIRLQQKLGNVQAAEVTILRAVQARPGDIRALSDAGVFYYGQSRFKEAEAAFRSIVGTSPQNASGLFKLGAVLFETGDYPEAETMFKRSLEIKASYLGYSNLGTLFYYDNRYQDAIGMFQRALDLKDGNYRVWMNLAEACTWAPGYEDSARTAFTKALLLAEPEFTGSPGQNMLVSDIASIQANLGHVDQARKLLTDLAEIPNLEAEVMFGMADTFEKLGSRAMALTWLERAVAKDLSLKKVKFYPGLRNLRAHGRFRALQDKYGD